MMGSIDMSNASAPAPMCDDCKGLDWRVENEAHANLEYKDGRKVSSMMGAADEAYYRCKVCGHEWLHETGSCGMGWVCIAVAARMARSTTMTSREDWTESILAPGKHQR